MGTQYEAQLELQNKMQVIVGNAIRPWAIGVLFLGIGLFIWWRIRRVGFTTSE